MLKRLLIPLSAVCLLVSCGDECSSNASTQPEFVESSFSLEQEVESSSSVKSRGSSGSAKIEESSSSVIVEESSSSVLSSSFMNSIYNAENNIATSVKAMFEACALQVGTCPA